MQHKKTHIRILMKMSHFLRVFFWWFGEGKRSLLKYIKQHLHIFLYGLGIRPLRKNIFQPLYGMDEWWERWVSLLVRLGHFAIMGLFASIGIMSFYLFFLVYLLFPFMSLYFIFSPQVIILIYMVLLVIYFLFKDVTKPSLKEQLTHKKPKNILLYANKEIRKIFYNTKLSFAEKIIKVLKTHDAKEFFYRLNFEEYQVFFNHFVLEDTYEEDILKLALKYAWKNDNKNIEIEDIIYALWEMTKSYSVWTSLDITEKQMKSVLLIFHKKQSLRAYQQYWASYSMFQNKHGIDRGLSSPYSKKLNEFTRDIVKNQKARNISPLIGRKKEYEHMIYSIKFPGAALLFIGDSGVGKTRIIEYFAENISIDNVPEDLRDQRLTELDIGRILSGDASNSAQEGGKNLISVLDDATKAKHIILNIDNLSSLAGDNLNALFNLSILSKYIENKKIRIIATSTQEDFDRVLSKHPTYIRQFTKIKLEPLNDVQTKEVLEYHALNFERKYLNIFAQQCFDTIIDISHKHRSDTQNPAKSLFLLEESILAHSKKKLINSEDVKDTLQKSTGIRLTKITPEERCLLQNLEHEIHKTLVGQDYAVNKIADALRRARLDLHDYKGPIAKFLFVGPTGVGKTELAKIVASIHFGSESKMLRLDMSEFQDTQSIKRLIGDMHDSGLLTEPVRNTAHMLILFDELEKAHPNILNLFLQLLDDGHITDGKGRFVDFRNTIIIATSNAGSHILIERLKEKKPFAEIEKEMKEKILIQSFRPEFLNRFNHLIVFEALQKNTVIYIAEKLLEKTRIFFQQKKIYLSFTSDAASKIANDAFNFEMGARPLKNMITDRLESALAKGLISGSFNQDDELVFDGCHLTKKL